jgi:hypothetical protein
MNTEEIIRDNAILILEQRKEIEKLKALLDNIESELPEEYTEIEYLPDLARYWVNRAKKLEDNWEKFTSELRELTYKQRHSHNL